MVVILSALIGVAAAVVAQGIGSVLARRRDRHRDQRQLAASMLAHGRTIQDVIARARKLGLESGEVAALLTDPLVPFVQTGYELRWLAHGTLRRRAVTFQDTVAEFVRDWNAQRDGTLDNPLAAAANAFDEEVERVTQPRKARRLWIRPKP